MIICHVFAFIKLVSTSGEGVFHEFETHKIQSGLSMPRNDLF